MGGIQPSSSRNFVESGVQPWPQLCTSCADSDTECRQQRKAAEEGGWGAATFREDAEAVLNEHDALLDAAGALPAGRVAELPPHRGVTVQDGLFFPGFMLGPGGQVKPEFNSIAMLCQEVPFHPSTHWNVPNGSPRALTV